MAKLVSKTYGDALFALAVEEHMVDQLYEEAQAVAQILRENTELTRLMNHPKIEKEEKVRLIEDIFKGRIGDELVGLLRMLVQKGHYKETDQVFTYFIDRVKEYKKNRYCLCDVSNGTDTATETGGGTKAARHDKVRSV